MRWIYKQIEKVRVKRRFLFLPKRIGNETRWLMTTSWIEEYFPATCAYDGGWKAIKWEDL